MPRGSGYAHYWSRSRQKLWLKGETSGMRQKVHQILVDDDQDCVILKVSLTSPDKGEVKPPVTWDIGAAFTEPSHSARLAQN